MGRAAGSPTIPTAVTVTSWHSAVLVCEKCAKHEAKHLVKGLRSALREHFGKKGVRVATVGCLDVCPKAGVTVLCVGPSGPQTLVVDADVDVDAAAEVAVAVLTRSPVQVP